MSIMMQHIEGELQYRCSSDSGSVMSSSRDCSNTVDEGQQAEHQQCKGLMSWISVILLLASIAIAHFLLSGSVYFWIASDML